MRWFKSEDGRGFLLALPTMTWLGLFFIVPLISIVVISFMTRGQGGVAELPYTLEHYGRTFDVFSVVLVRSIRIAVITTILCLLIGYPLAFFISTRQNRTFQNLCLFFVILPFWTNFLVRTYAWRILLGEEGTINSMLLNWGWIQQPIEMLNTEFAVLVGLVYAYFPFMVLPIYASVERFDFKFVDAAHDLGANDWTAFWRVVLPMTLPGVLAGCALVFIPSVGAFVTPDLLGGTRGLMIGNLIARQWGGSGNMPLGSALSVVMMSVVMLSLVIYVRRDETVALLQWLRSRISSGVRWFLSNRYGRVVLLIAFFLMVLHRRWPDRFGITLPGSWFTTTSLGRFLLLAFIVLIVGIVSRLAQSTSTTPQQNLKPDEKILWGVMLLVAVVLSASFIWYDTLFAKLEWALMMALQNWLYLIALLGVGALLVTMLSQYFRYDGTRRSLVRRDRTMRQAGIIGLYFNPIFSYFFLWAPILVLVIFSFNESRSVSNFTGFTLRWYNNILNGVMGTEVGFSTENMLFSLRNSMIVGFFATTIATIIGTMVALALSRSNFPGKQFLDGLMFLPVVIPEITQAISLAIFFNVFFDWWANQTGQRLFPGFHTIIIGHVAFNISYVAIVVRARLADMNPRLEEAARDLGANEWRTFWHITLPLILPGVIAGALLAFTLSLDDFVITFFTSGVGTSTLPIFVYGLLKLSITPEINAISTVIMVISTILIGISMLLQGRNALRG